MYENATWGFQIISLNGTADVGRLYGEKGIVSVA
jgi:hypothetical protein